MKRILLPLLLSLASGTASALDSWCITTPKSLYVQQTLEDSGDLVFSYLYDYKDINLKDKTVYLAEVVGGDISDELSFKSNLIKEAISSNKTIQLLLKNCDFPESNIPTAKGVSLDRVSLDNIEFKVVHPQIN